MRKLFFADLKLLFRNRQSLFWSLAFPLIFTVIFGFFFSADASKAGTVVIVNHSSSSIAQSLEKVLSEDASAIKIQKEESDDAARTDIKKGKAAAAVIIPEHFGDSGANTPTNVTILYDPGSQTARAALEGYVNAFLTHTNFAVAQVTPTYSFTEERANTTTTYGYFDFVLVGIVGMSLMNSAIQGLAIAMSKYREDKIIKRITTTPLPGWKFILAEVSSRLVLNVFQVALILFIGIKGFHATITNLPALFILSLLGAVLFQLAGFFIAAVSRDTDAAEGMSSAIATPMMFLSGVFFAIDQLPKWLYSIVQYLPLSPLLKTMRSFSLDNGSLGDNATNLYLIGVWIILLLGITVYRFRLTEE